MLFSPIRADQGTDAAALGKVSALFGLLLRVSDAGVVMLAAMLAFWLRFGTFDLPLEFERAVLRGVLLTLLIFGASGVYGSWRGRRVIDEATQVLLLWIAVFALGLMLVWMLRMTGLTSRLFWGYWFVGTVAASALVRFAIRRTNGWLRARGVDLRTAVVVGAGNEARRVNDKLQQQAWAGIDVRGWFTADPQDGHEASQADVIPRLGDVDALADYVEAHHIDQVWIALPMQRQMEIDRIVRSLDHATADIKFVPDLFGLQLLNHSVEQVAGVPVINLRASPLDGEARVLKAIEDRVLAALILLLISPLLAAIAIGVKLSSPGPVLFKQKRHGLGGRPIEVWKFRSMRIHQEAHGQVTQATRHDSRITPFGRFLRRSSLDELPQFFNVLQGTMSIVGPRPHAVEHNHHYRTLVQSYMQRHRVKPGITGWAQVNGLRGETDTVDKMAARVEHDLYYLQNWSVLFDLRIVVLTVVRGFTGSTAY